MYRLTIIIAAIFFCNNSYSQIPVYTSQIDSTVSIINKIVSAGVNTGDFIRPVMSDEGGEVFLNHRYTIDTLKRVLYKATHDYIDGEKINFYYYNQNIIKAIISDTSETNTCVAEYYFNKDSIILIKEKGLLNRKNLLDKTDILSLSKQYVEDYHRICEMLDKRKKIK